MEPELVVEVERRGDGVVGVRVVGDVDRDSAGSVLEAFERALAGDEPARVVFDLGGVGFLDSAGIRVLVTCRERAELVGARLEVERAHENVRQVLTITDLLGVLRVAP
ncbi:STAS domain-containing protein [Catenuloplanes indicus]|uniref:Anti-sigma factor antagonist n=1 Tax=Catenuloplanes indicus TaxID=137267 RepID=A0AAE3W2B3_9ACTN|nr:STAS domain-containing protein [Catenuloplanes indicus]MDQ0368623.1 anti-anti-sigma factor [Catenuloplanes indicus]